MEGPHATRRMGRLVKVWVLLTYTGSDDYGTPFMGVDSIHATKELAEAAAEAVPRYQYDTAPGIEEMEVLGS